LNEVFTQHISHPGPHKRTGLNITREFSSHEKIGHDPNAGAAPRNTCFLTGKQAIFYFIKWEYKTYS